jgi:23S rRNA pseudouridine2457 synthase
LSKHKYYIIYKPFQTLSQFSKDGDKKTLAHFFKVERDVYPVGRLDYDSEGLLILTNDKFLNNQLLHPNHKHQKTYWVQVEGTVNTDKIEQLQSGVSITVEGKPYITKPCTVKDFSQPPTVCERNPPIRFRQNIPTTWLSICLTEGKNRQVRKMTASVGLPTLRLIRNSIENIALNNMQPGDIVEISKNNLYKKLNITASANH